MMLCIYASACSVMIVMCTHKNCCYYQWILILKVIVTIGAFMFPFKLEVIMRNLLFTIYIMITLKVVLINVNLTCTCELIYIVHKCSLTVCKYVYKSHGCLVFHSLNFLSV